MGALRIAVVVADGERGHDLALAPRLRVEDRHGDDVDVDVLAQALDRAARVLHLVLVQLMRLQQPRQVLVAQHQRAQALHVLIGVQRLVRLAGDRVLQRAAHGALADVLRAFDLDQGQRAVDVGQASASSPPSARIGKPTMNR